jgi:cell division protein FtsQ
MTENQPKVPAIREPHIGRKRGSRKLLALLFLFFITVLAILFFQSSLSKISKIEIEGNQLVPAAAIGQAAGIHTGGQFFGVPSRVIASRVSGLPAVESVKVTKHFPGIIHIRVKEYVRVGFQFSASGGVQALLADGSAIDVETRGLVLDKPILNGWQGDDPLKVQLCRTLSAIPDYLLADVSEIRPEPSASYKDKIKMYTRSQYVVYTTISYLPDKIKYMGAFIDNLKKGNSVGGIITMLENDTYTPPDAGQDAGKTQSAGKPQPSGKP